MDKGKATFQGRKMDKAPRITQWNAKEPTEKRRFSKFHEIIYAHIYYTARTHAKKRAHARESFKNNYFKIQEKIPLPP